MTGSSDLKPLLANVDALRRYGHGVIRLLGAGRAGKTGLANNIMGKAFSDTESTTGMDVAALEISESKASVCGGDWRIAASASSDKAYESELAKALQATTSRSQTKDVSSSPPPSSTSSINATVAKTGPPPSSSNTNQGNAPSAASLPTSPQSNMPSLPKDFDSEFVVKCLQDGLQLDADLKVSIFDYGGQEVFNAMHQFFFTQNGVYCVVFNMEDLCSAAAPDVVESSLSELQSWFGSVATHTRGSDGSLASVIIVGTHKDKVPSVQDHDVIHSRLLDRFRNHCIWQQSLIWNSNYCYYPVDNTSGRDKDVTTQQLMAAIKDNLMRSPIVNAKKPLAWLKAMDLMKETKKSYLRLSDVKEIIAGLGGNDADVPPILGFLHEMGVLMWHGDSDQLRNVAILDPVAFFVVPASMIIRNHISNANDRVQVVHTSEVHKWCERNMKYEWLLMTEKGVLHRRLLEQLLQNFKEMLDSVVELMLKFGLLVLLRRHQKIAAAQFDSSNPELHNHYLVPSLLQAAPRSFSLHRTNDNSMHGCYFLFEINGMYENARVIGAKDLSHGYMPNGLFELLLCKAVAWCEQTSLLDVFGAKCLFKDRAMLQFGRQRFQISMVPRWSCIYLEVEGGSPLAVQRRLLTQIEGIIKDSMKGLRCVPAVAVEIEASSIVDLSRPYLLDAVGFEEFERKVMLLPMSQLSDVAAGKSPVVQGMGGGRPLMTKAQAREMYLPWIEDVVAVPSRFDVFISYRWNELDSPLTEQLRTALGVFNISGDGGQQRPIVTFLDTQRLEDGVNFQQAFIKALVASTVVTPIISPESLLRMTKKKHDPSQVDNVLAEWIAALECVNTRSSGAPGHSSGSVRRIFPIMFGQRNVSNGAAAKDLFSVGILGELSDVVPTKTIELVNSLLRSEGVVDNQFVIRDRTVKEIVSELTNCKGFLAWDSETPSMDAAEKIANILTKVGSEAGNVQKSIIIPVGSSNAPNGGHVVQPSASTVTTHNGNSTPVSSPNPDPNRNAAGGTLTVLQMAGIIKRELGYDKDLPVKNFIDEISSDALNESEIEELSRIKKLAEKLQYIAEKMGVSFS